MKLQFSAGGIVYKNQRSKIKDQKGNLLILVGQHSQHKGWVFPKGLIGDTVQGEKKEDTAIREVEEETGVLAKIIEPLEEVTYWFVFEGEKIKKTVYYFVMQYAGEDHGKKDEEMVRVEWIPINEVEKRLTYGSDKKAWKEAQIILNSKF